MLINITTFEKLIIRKRAHGFKTVSISKELRYVFNVLQLQDKFEMFFFLNPWCWAGKEITHGAQLPESKHSE
jgi:hypothetical protein